MSFVAFAWNKARYSKGLEAVKPHNDGSGFKTREARLAEYFARRWSGRESAYLMTAKAIDKMLNAYQSGYDASPISGALIAPSTHYTMSVPDVGVQYEVGINGSQKIRAFYGSKTNSENTINTVHDCQSR